MAKGKGKQSYARSHGISTRRVTNRGGLGAYNVMRARSENRRGYAIFNRERFSTLQEGGPVIQAYTGPGHQPQRAVIEPMPDMTSDYHPGLSPEQWAWYVAHRENLEAEPEDSEQSQTRPDQGMMIASWSLFGLIVLAVVIFIILFLFF